MLLINIAIFCVYALHSQLESTVESLSGEQVGHSVEKTKTTLFDYIYQLEGRPLIELETDTRLLIKNKLKEPYQATHLNILDKDKNLIIATNAKVRARGNMRKQVSFLPPLKIDLKKTILDSLGFLKLDDLKLVLPANRSKNSQEKLYQEYFLYELYQRLDSNAIRVKLVDINISFRGKEKYQLTGFLIEDEEDYERRKAAKIIKKGIVGESMWDQESFAKMIFFQYMIGNTDFSLKARHNIEMVKMRGSDKITFVPFDFDYSGFVNQKYAMPHPDLPIDDVRTRYFYSGYKIEETDCLAMVDFYLSSKEEIIQYCDSATYMNAKTINRSKKYLIDFFKILEKSKRVRLIMIK